MAFAPTACLTSSSAFSGDGIRALPNTTTVDRTPQSRSSSSGLPYSMANRSERISSRSKNSVSSTASK
jgi:hypothetical protein